MPKKTDNNYHTLCLKLLNLILSDDKIKLTYVNAAYVHVNAFTEGINSIKINHPFEGLVFDYAAAIAQNNHHKLLFFFSDQEQKPTQELVKKIYAKDQEQFNLICFMILPTYAEMNTLRCMNYADEWPRVFFMCFEEIRQKAEEIDKESYNKICDSLINTVTANKNQIPEIATIEAEVIDNIPVGGKNPNHFKLRFTTPDLAYILPGQFIMIKTQPLINKTNPPKTHPIKSWSDLNPSISSAFKTTPSSYLKRPFGIHRAFYKNFGPHFLQKLRLPTTLSCIAHIVFPHEFDIFYKVIQNGVGTHELSQLKKHDRIELLGPLGKSFPFVELHRQGIEEIHVIGGGVGMAPLIYMVQSLRFFNFTVKAFIGIESYDLLCHHDDYLFCRHNDHAKSYSENPQNARLFIDDLLAAGLLENDIFLSCDKPSTKTNAVNPLNTSIKNYHLGVISQQYENYLKKDQTKKRIYAFTCGPPVMMKAIDKITLHYKIPLKVLMEKRMACGIGVCLSCVCHTRTKNNEKTYARVCTDGPLFDAGEIDWSHEKE